MSALTRIVGSFGRGDGQPLRMDRPPWIRQSRTFGASPIADPERAMAVGAVFACVRAISQTVGGTPLHVYREAPAGPRERALTSPLWNVCARQAYPGLPAPLLWQITSAHLAGWGEAFLLKYLDRGRLVATYPLHPARTKVCDRDGEILYETQGKDGRTVELSAREVLHVRYMSLDGVTGVSPLELASRELAAIDSEATFRQSLLANGARLSGVLTTPNELSDDAVKRITAEWSAKHGGAGNAGSVALLEGGLSWLPMSAAPKDLEFVQQRNASVADVARWFGVPPSIVNAPSQDSLTYSTVEGEAIAFVRWCLQPGYFTPIAAAINCDPDFVPAGSGLEVEFQTGPLLEADGLARAQAAEIYLRNKVVTINEVREGEHLAPLPDGDLPKPTPAAPPASPATSSEDTP